MRNKHKELNLVAALVLGTLTWGTWACQESAKSPAKPSEEEGAAKRAAKPADITSEHYPMDPLPRTHLRIRGSFSGKTEIFSVEIADTPKARTRGLMWREFLGRREGMLFDFGEEGEQSFWMKNTLLSLDLVFISEARKVVGVIERATPQSLSPLSIGRPSRYVLEVPGGTCAQIGIAPGAELAWEDA